MIKGVLTAGLLVGAGFLGGFSLSNGSGEVLGIKPIHSATSRMGNADEQAAAGIMNAADGDGPGDSSRHPTIHQSGGGGGEGGASGGTASGFMAGTLTDHADDALKGPHHAGGTVTLTGAEAARMLAGNTIDSGQPNRPHLTFYASRGLRAEGDQSGYVVTPWNARSGSLCEPGSDGVMVCHALQVRSVSASGTPADGAEIGRLLISDNRWAPIYKGNLLGVPNHIPFVESAVAEPEADLGAGKATAKGQAALNALIGHVASVDPADGSSDRPGILYLIADGRFLTMNRPDGVGDQADSIKVSAGRWTFAKGLMCLNGGAKNSSATCSKPEAWGQTAIHLVPVGKGEESHLTLLAESPRSRLDTAD